MFITVLSVLVLLTLLTVFLLSPVTVSVVYDRNFQKNEADVKVEMWRGLLRYEKKVKIGEPAGGAKKDGTKNKQEEPSIDEMDGSFRVIAKSLNELKGYGEKAKELTADIQLTRLEISLSYGAEDAPKTAMATGILWGIVSTAVAFMGHFFQLIVIPKTEVIPYFMMKKPLELHIGCIGKIRLANAIKAIWKLARFMQKKQQLHSAGKQSHKGKNQMA